MKTQLMNLSSALLLSMGLVLAGSLGPAGAAAPNPLDDWTLVHPPQPLSPWRSVAYGNGRYVVVAGDVARPQFIWSSNAVDWTPSPANLPYYYSDVLFAEGKFWVAGGEDDAPAVILNSVDGVEWQVAFSDSREFFRRLCYANGTWVAIEVDEDTAPRLVVSTNGIDWAPSLTAPSFTYLDVLDGLWLGVDYLGQVYRSTNGLDWSAGLLINNFTNGNRDTLSGIAAGDGLFLAFGSRVRIDPLDGGYYQVPFITTSADGVSWSGTSIAELPPRRFWDVYSIASGTNGFLALVRDFLGDDLRLLRSRDGAVWTVHPAPALTQFRRVSFVNGLYFITGEQGVIFTSPDGMAWTQRLGASTRQLRGLAEGWNGLVAVGNGGLVLKAPEGTNWTRQEGITQENLADIVTHGRRYTIVGGTRNAFLLLSANGRKWRAVSNANYGPLQSATVDNGNRVLAVGLRGSLARIRQNRVNFFQSAGREDFRAVTSLGKLFIAVATSAEYPEWNNPGTVYTSLDGLNWTARFTHSSALWCVAGGDLAAVAAGANGSFVSSNGLNWQPITIASNASFWTTLDYAGGVFLAAGGVPGKVFSSSNGVDWTEHEYSAFPDSGLLPNIWSFGGTPSLAHSHDRFYVAGAPEYLWRGGLFVRP